MKSAMHAPFTRGRMMWSAGVILGASLPHWLYLPVWMPALLCACVAWRIESGRRHWRGPGRAARMALALLAFTAVLTQYHTINGVEAGSALLVVMVALKFLEAQTHRDQVVLMIIAYFLVFASLLEQQSIAIGIYLIGFVLVTTVGLLQLGRRGSMLPTGRTAALAARMLLQALPIMVVLFFLFPRLPGPLWALPPDTRSATTGLSDTMSPGDITELGLSDEVAFRVEFFDAAPSAERLYWRGPVLASFDGRRWSRDFGVRPAGSAAIEYLAEPTEYRVMLEPNGRGWAFALDVPRQWSGVERMMMTSDYQLLVPPGRRAASRLDYLVTSHTTYRTLDGLNERERSYLTRLPDDVNPRTRALAAAWVQRGLSPEAVVEEALRFLRDQPFFYTLTPPPLGDHAADEFLFETREGFCEHYASAFAVMMRAAGLPARIVTGYQGAELNQLGRYYIVRQSDAHAWTEVWLDGRGWLRVDPTAAVAPERIEVGSLGGLAGGSVGSGLAGMGWVRTARYAWDALNTYWYGWVVGYGELTQRLLLERLGFGRATYGEMIMAAAAGVALVLAVLTVWQISRQRRRTRPDAAQRFFSRFCRQIERRRVAPRRPAESPAAYAARAERELPAAAAAVRQITAAYLRARYEPDPDGEALRQLRRLVGNFRPTRVR